MSADPQVTAQWARVCKRLKQEVGDTAFRAWLQPLAVQEIKDDEIQFVAPTRFMRDWVMTHYSERIRALWASEDARVRSVNLMVVPDKAAGEAGPGERRGNGVDGDAASETLHGGTPRLVIGGADGVPACAGSFNGQQAMLAAARAGGFGAQETDPRLEIGAAGRTLSGFGAGASAPAMLPAQPVGGDERDEEIGPLDPRFTFDNFVVGKPNELAHAAARKVADAQAVTFNPLFLYSGVGLGKTHLMHAIAWAIRRKFPGRRVVYLSAERFMYQFIRALRFKDTVAFKEQYRSVDVLMIDDVQFISGKESTQEEFFHTFNALVDQNRQVVVSADKSPSDLDGMEERLKSRLGWGLVADIHPTTYELRLGVLHSKAEYLGIKVHSKVLEFLAHRITSNIRELEGALNRIIAHSELVGRPANIETTQELLRDLLRANDRRVSIDEIQRKVAEHFKVRFADMVSSRRARVVARPRQVAMYLSKQLTPRSLPEIGRKFGGRDHTTVLHAVRKVEELIGEDASFAEEVELLRKMLEG